MRRHYPYHHLLNTVCLATKEKKKEKRLLVLEKSQAGERVMVMVKATLQQQ